MLGNSSNLETDRKGGNSEAAAQRLKNEQEIPLKMKGFRTKPYTG